MVLFPSTWWLLAFFSLLLVPPTFFIGYLAGKRRMSLRFLLAMVTVESVALGILAWMIRR